MSYNCQRLLVKCSKNAESKILDISISLDIVHIPHWVNYSKSKDQFPKLGVILREVK